jgi:organic radical activating enzyme
MDEPIYVLNSSLSVTYRCNIKCKHCLQFNPYYAIDTDYDLQDVLKLVEQYFSIVDRVEKFTVSGGEPFLRSDLPLIIDKMRQYQPQIGKIILTTNGTLLPSDALIEQLSSMSCIEVNISNYGPSLSTEVEKIEQILTKRQIRFETFSYSGDDLRYGGWIDFTDHTLKHKTQKSIREIAKLCANRNGGNIVLVPGRMFVCFRVMRRFDLGIIDDEEASYVDLNADMSIKDLRNHTRKLLAAPYTPACAYCVGKYLEAPHLEPAIQLTNDELKKGVERI